MLVVVIAFTKAMVTMANQCQLGWGVTAVNFKTDFARHSDRAVEASCSLLEEREMHVSL